MDVALVVVAGERDEREAVALDAADEVQVDHVRVLPVRRQQRPIERAARLGVADDGVDRQTLLAQPGEEVGERRILIVHAVRAVAVDDDARRARLSECRDERAQIRLCIRREILDRREQSQPRFLGRLDRVDLRAGAGELELEAVRGPAVGGGENLVRFSDTGGFVVDLVLLVGGCSQEREQDGNHGCFSGVGGGSSNWRNASTGQQAGERPLPFPKCHR